MSAKKRKPSEQGPTEPKVEFYPGWCKRCGICVAFCPKQVLETDEWGYPYVARPESCITCHMCEKLCPDFAVSVREEAAEAAPRKAPAAGSTESHPRAGTPRSPERVAPEPPPEDTADE